MSGARAAAATLLDCILVGGCSTPLIGDDLHMCSAAELLSSSIAITEESFALDLDERPEEAVERAVQALGLAERASRELQQVEAAAQAAPVWQSLIRAYEAAADAARSLFPEPQERGLSGPELLSVARHTLDGARVGVPPICFTMSAP